MAGLHESAGANMGLGDGENEDGENEDGGGRVP